MIQLGSVCSSLNIAFVVGENYSTIPRVYSLEKLLLIAIEKPMVHKAGELYMASFFRCVKLFSEFEKTNIRIKCLTSGF